jgi:uncharacterized membrane protein
VTVRRLERSPPLDRPVRRSEAGPGWWLGTRAAGLVLLALLVPVHRLWAVQLLLIPLLLVLPGEILLRALRVPGRAIASFPVYVPCASLAVLIGSGLAVDLVGPVAGVAAPLRTAPLLAGLEAACAVLLAASVKAPPATAIPWQSLRVPVVSLLPLVLPLLAAAGALRLNAGHGAGVALTAVWACLLVFIAVLAYAKWLEPVLLATVIYAIALAMLWSFSLRGNLVYGYDISDEYYVFHHTVTAGVWHLGHPGDAYGAMLSTTVLPTALHAVAGVPEQAVFTVVYPAITALFPVAVFWLARRMLSLRWAFTAAALILTQATFGQELPAIARQEIALMLFVALVAALLDRRLRRYPQWALAAVFGAALVLSHYSTTYLAVSLIGISLVLQWGLSWLRQVPRVSGAFAVALVVTLVGAATWYGPVTHSASNLSQFVQSAEGQGFNLLPNRVAGQGIIAAYLQGNTSAPMSAAQYAQAVHQQYVKDKPYVTPLRDAGRPRYALRNSAAPAPPVKSSAGSSAIAAVQVIVQQLEYLLAAVGALMLVLRRRAGVLARQVGLFSLATLLLLVATRLSGTIAAAYNGERAVLQSMVVLVIAVCWPLSELMERGWRWLPVASAAVGAALAVMFMSGSGLAGAALGGGTATNLANSGEDYERFYMTTPELAAAQWVGDVVLPGQLIYADRYGQLPLIAMTGIGRGLMLDVTPMTLDQHAWVYASTTNVVDGRGRAQFNGDDVVYVYPSRFLHENYNLVYTDGSSEVFHR